MQRAQPLEQPSGSADDREAANAASRSSPLELVSAAVAGEDLRALARAASSALGCPIAVVMPSLGEAFVTPGKAIAEQDFEQLMGHAEAMIGAERSKPLRVEATAMPVRIGQETVGIVAAIAPCSGLDGPPSADAQIRPWLEAAAAASSVAALMRSAQERGLKGSRRPLLQALGTGAPAHIEAFISDALRLGFDLGSGSQGRDQTYRLLVGILFRDPDELEQLRAQTISSLLAYDSKHGTDLVVTLREFLTHHGSTTETAEAMRLHRHTVGYRLARVQEVSGLSPYESEGRERLSLGLKADQILTAHERLRN